MPAGDIQQDVGFQGFLVEAVLHQIADADDANEVVAVDKDGALYLFMDDNGPRSFARRLTCSGW